MKVERYINGKKATREELSKKKIVVTKDYQLVKKLK